MQAGVFEQKVGGLDAYAETLTVAALTERKTSRKAFLRTKTNP